MTAGILVQTTILAVTLAIAGASVRANRRRARGAHLLRTHRAIRLRVYLADYRGRGSTLMTLLDIDSDALHVAARMNGGTLWPFGGDPAGDHPQVGSLPAGTDRGRFLVMRVDAVELADIDERTGQLDEWDGVGPGPIRDRTLPSTVELGDESGGRQ